MEYKILYTVKYRPMVVLILCPRPQTLYRTWKKTLVKHVFNFGSMQQDHLTWPIRMENGAYVTVMFEKRLQY